MQIVPAITKKDTAMKTIFETGDRGYRKNVLLLFAENRGEYVVVLGIFFENNCYFIAFP